MTRREISLGEALAQGERLGRELEQERARSRRLEEELRSARRLEALGRAAGGIAHDFSNILAVITGHSELMLKRMDAADPLRAGAESIRKAAAWGLNLTKQVLTASRAVLPPPSVVDLNLVVAGVVRALQPLLGEGIEVSLRAEPRLGTVAVSVEPLEQALMNLILNARDAMPGGGHLTIETRNATFEQSPARRLRAVMVRVSDTGHGMDADTLARVFEPYFTTKPPGKGNGLGLATVFAFATQAGGHVEGASEVGQGASFSLYLPRVDAEPVAAPRSGGATVLVVEAETGVRELIGEILEIHGYHVLCARDLDEARAVSLRHAGPIALVIADLTSSGISVHSLPRGLGLRPEQPDARVLYLSGDLDNGVEESRARQAGRGFLHKPFTVDALLQKVTESLK